MAPDVTLTARLERSVQHVSDNLTGDLSLTALADAACLSPFHFHRLFKQHTGETVREHVERVRLEHAVGLRRRRPELGLAEVAAACGYGSQTVFARAFRRRFGVTPAAFDFDGWAAARPDATDVQAVSAHYLRTAPEAPADFAVEVRRLPEARLAYVRVADPYTQPAKLMSAFERVLAFAEAHGLPVEERLSGGSRDDPEVTALKRCRYDVALELPEGFRPGRELPVQRRAAGDWALHAVAGDLAAVDRAWNVLFKTWLPASGLAPRDAPAMEIYRKDPRATGWGVFDLWLCLPVEPLTRRRR